MVTSTMNWETFKNAPIIEAILDFRLELPEDVKVEALADAFADVANRYPIREEHIEWAGSLHFSKGQVSTGLNHGLAGYRFLSTDRKRIVQARLKSFTVNHLRPYQRWDALRGDGQMLWTLFCAVARPRSINRIALRYVNRIVVPPETSPGEYLLVGPRLEGELHTLSANRLSAYNVNLKLFDQNRHAEAILRCYTEPTPTEETGAGLILDIDVFRTGSFAPDGDEPWAILTHLREWKNELFFAATTEKAKEGFRR